MNLIKKFVTLDSTNRYAVEELNLLEVTEFGIVWALEQFAGKGMQENIWESEAGKNLTFSMVLFPKFLHANQQFVITQVISLAVVDYLRQYLPHNEVKIKWPNDIYVGLDKICGMLIHNKIIGNSLSATVVGIGININQEKFLSNAPNPVSLKNSTGNTYNLETELDLVSKFIEARYHSIKENGVNIFSNEYSNTLLYYKETAKYIYKKKEIEAIIQNVNEFGHLELLTSNNQKIVCNLKELVFLHHQ